MAIYIELETLGDFIVSRNDQGHPTWITPSGFANGERLVRVDRAKVSHSPTSPTQNLGRNPCAT